MTQTKQQKALARMVSFGGFQCPLCFMPLVVKNTSLQCEKGHTFDISRKGYTHLHHKTVSSAYDKNLFSARRTVFDAGFFRPVVQALKDILVPAAPGTLLDAGCGEGYYLDSLSPSLPQALLAGVDLSKEAIVMAAGREINALYCVADINRLPFQNGVFDSVINVLSPANYASFSRVLKKDGLFIKVMPGREYLQEIRGKLPGKKADYDDERVPEYLKAHMQVLSLSRLHYALPLSLQIFTCFVAMTPMTESLTEDERSLLKQDVPKQMTIDLQLAVCKALT